MQRKHRNAGPRPIIGTQIAPATSPVVLAKRGGQGGDRRCAAQSALASPSVARALGEPTGTPLAAIDRRVSSGGTSSPRRRARPRGSRLEQSKFRRRRSMGSRVAAGPASASIGRLRDVDRRSAASARPRRAGREGDGRVPSVFDGPFFRPMGRFEGQEWRCGSTSLAGALSMRGTTARLRYRKFARGIK